MKKYLSNELLDHFDAIPAPAQPQRPISGLEILEAIVLGLSMAALFLGAIG